MPAYRELSAASKQSQQIDAVLILAANNDGSTNVEIVYIYS
jgi:hypothetical protein